MSDGFYDPIVAEVRRNREAILAEFGGDMGKYRAYLKSKRPEIEAAGFRFETEEERQARLAWRKKQDEERKVAEVLEKAQAILDAEHSSAYFNGRDDGILQVAQTMLHRGHAPQEVAKVTGLSSEQVSELARQLQVM